MPWKLVADLREIAFGPLRAVVELEPVTVRLNELDARLEAVLREAAKLTREVPSGNCLFATCHASATSGPRAASIPADVPLHE